MVEILVHDSQKGKSVASDRGGCAAFARLPVILQWRAPQYAIRHPTYYGNTAVSGGLQALLVAL